MAKYDPEIQRLAKKALAKIRALVPGAVELVYDNYNALVIGFGPTERASEAIISLALYPRWVNLFFLQGVKLSDPHKLLKGSGKQVRSIMLRDAADLDREEVRALVARAIERSAKPIQTSRRRTIVKSISAKQRPRRPATRTSGTLD